jgi:hypothetical protein
MDSNVGDIMAVNYQTHSKCENPYCGAFVLQTKYYNGKMLCEPCNIHQRIADRTKKKADIKVIDEEYERQLRKSYGLKCK